MTHKRNTSGLRPFQKGQTGNPGGKPKLPVDLKGIAELTADELKRTIAKYARMTKAQVQAAIQSPSTSMIELNIATIFAKGTQNGDAMRLAFLLDRAIGKPQVVDNDGLSGRVEVSLNYDPKRKLNGTAGTEARPGTSSEASKPGESASKSDHERDAH